MIPDLSFEMGRYYQRGLEIATDTRRDAAYRERKVLREGEALLDIGPIGPDLATALLAGYTAGVAA